jgi:hypothetical protein
MRKDYAERLYYKSTQKMHEGKVCRECMREKSIGNAVVGQFEADLLPWREGSRRAARWNDFAVNDLPVR